MIAFHADVTKLIPFYAIGVFTSFSLSQAGMAKRHLRLREPGWRVGLLINGAGAVATAIVLVIIARTKFAEGAWAILVLVPLFVWLLVRMNKQYQHETVELERDLAAFTAPNGRAPIAVLLVDDLDPKTVHALQYARTIRCERTIAVHLEQDPERTRALIACLGRGRSRARSRCGSSAVEATRRPAWRASSPPTRARIARSSCCFPFPTPARPPKASSDRRAGARLNRALLPYQHVRVTLVRDHPEGVHPLQRDDEGRPVVRLTTRGTHEVVVLVDKLDRATLQALSYGLDLGATTIRAVHAAADPDRAARLAQRWMELQAPVPLDVIECWDRDVPRALERYVVAMASETSEITAVMPRRDYPRLRQRLLHDRTSRKIQRALGRYAHVDVADIPFYVHATTASRDERESAVR